MSKKKKARKRINKNTQVAATKGMRRKASVRGRLKLHDKLLAQTLVALRSQTIDNDAHQDMVMTVLNVLAKAMLRVAPLNDALYPEDEEALRDFLELSEVEPQPDAETLAGVAVDTRPTEILRDLPAAVEQLDNGGLIIIDEPKTFDLSDV